MFSIINESYVKARKTHMCNACDEILGWINRGVFTFADYRLIAKAKKKRYNILKNDTYLRQCYSRDGQVFTYKALPEIHELRRKYDLFDDL